MPHDTIEANPPQEKPDLETPLTPGETLRVRIAVAIAAGTLLGTLGTGAWALTQEPDQGPRDNTSLYDDGIWNGTVTWEDSSTSYLRFRSSAGRVPLVTIYQGPSTCTASGPIVIRTHAHGTSIKNLRLDTSNWELSTDYTGGPYATGTLTPYGPCRQTGTVTAWTRD